MKGGEKQDETEGQNDDIFPNAQFFHLYSRGPEIKHPRFSRELRHHEFRGRSRLRHVDGSEGGVGDVLSRVTVVSLGRFGCRDKQTVKRMDAIKEDVRPRRGQEKKKTGSKSGREKKVSIILGQ